MAFGLTIYPTLGANLRNGVVITAERLGLLSAYRPVDLLTDSQDTHVMEM